MTINHAVFDYLLDYLVEKATPEEIMAFQLPDDFRQYRNTLAHKNQTGDITPDETAELAGILETEALVTALRARAMKSTELKKDFFSRYTDELINPQTGMISLAQIQREHKRRLDMGQFSTAPSLANRWAKPGHDLDFDELEAAISEISQEWEQELDDLFGED